MKTSERLRAIQLRRQGKAMGEIAKELGVAKSSVSYWVRDIQLTTQQRRQLNRNGHSLEVIEKRRQARLKNTEYKRMKLRQQAAAEVRQLEHDPLWCLGVALYWGEGGKTQQTVRLSNSDPAVISLMMRFFRETCGVSEHQFRGHVHTFASDNARAAERYWSAVSGISTDKFYKTYVKPSRASKQKRTTLVHGTFQIYVHDSKFFFRMLGWIDQLKNQYSQS